MTSRPAQILRDRLARGYTGMRPGDFAETDRSGLVGELETAMLADPTWWKAPLLSRHLPDQYRDVLRDHACASGAQEVAA